MPTLPKRPYGKPALTPVELLSHLRDKGLDIGSPPDAVYAIETIGYYRLLIYFRAFQDGNKRFLPNTTFTDVLSLYSFDRGLRLLCLGATERLEVALRASINNRLAVAYGPHFYMEPKHFERFNGFQNFASHAVKNYHPLTQYYFNTYSAPDAPPIWVLTEVLSFGKLSRFFADLTNDCRKTVAQDFGFAEGLLVSWFRCLTDFRNRCAHHERIWNACMLSDQPMRAKALPELKTQDRFYARAILIMALLRRIEPGDAWRNQLKAFLATHPFINPVEMGFPEGWETLPLWSSSIAN